MAESLAEVAAALKFELSSVAPPDGESGAWLFVFSKFGRKGFVRALAREHEPRLFFHFLLPAWSIADAEKLAQHYKEVTSDTCETAAFEGGFRIMMDVNGDWIGPLTAVGRLADFVDTELTAAAALSLITRGSSVAAPTAPQEVAAKAAPAFETIGDEPNNVEPMSFRIEKRPSDCRLEFEDGGQFTGSDRARLLSGLRTLLRVHLDVDADGMQKETSLELLVTNTEWSELTSVDALEQEILRVIRPLMTLTQDGISPLAFFDAEATMPPRGVAHAAPVVTTLEREQIVFSTSEDAALRTGDFEDQRLREPDSTESLVDVVLRHPGYSDRRVGQVLSILLSVEYHSALQLMRSAPIVIARGVAHDRGLSIKELVENAGGKIQLTDPSRYPIA